MCVHRLCWRRPAVEILKDALTRLEYRGYDSAGIATIDGGKVHICKNKGKVAMLSPTAISKICRAAPVSVMSDGLPTALSPGRMLIPIVDAQLKSP